MQNEKSGVRVNRQTCPFCFEETRGGTHLVSCPKCEALQHASCAREAGECAGGCELDVSPVEGVVLKGSGSHIPTPSWLRDFPDESLAEIEVRIASLRDIARWHLGQSFKLGSLATLLTLASVLTGLSETGFLRWFVVMTLGAFAIATWLPAFSDVLSYFRSRFHIRELRDSLDRQRAKEQQE